MNRESVNHFTVGKVSVVLFFVTSRLLNITNPVTHSLHPRVSIGHVISSYSFLKYGTSSFEFTTYAESNGGLHLFAITGSPFVKILGPTGLKTHSIILTGGAIVVAYYLVKELADSRKALLAAGILSASPMMIFFGRAAFPESFSLFSATLCIYGYINYSRYRSQVWLSISLLSLALAIADHLWAAFLIGPLAILTLQKKDLKGFSSYVFVTSTVLVGSYLAISRGGQPGAVEAYSVLYNAEYLISREFYSDLILQKFRFVFSTVLTGIILLSAFVYLVCREYKEIVLWFFAGLSIPILLPRGSIYHIYYLWGVLIPGAILLSLFSFDVVDWISDYDIRGLTETRVVTVLTVGFLYLLLFTANIYSGGGLFVEQLDGSASVKEGETLSQLINSQGISPSEVAIVTHLPTGIKETRDTLLLHTYLAYGNTILNAPQSPQVYESIEDAKESEHKLILDFRSSWVENPSSNIDPTYWKCDSGSCSTVNATN